MDEIMISRKQLSQAFPNGCPGKQSFFKKKNP